MFTGLKSPFEDRNKFLKVERGLLTFLKNLKCQKGPYKILKGRKGLSEILRKLLKRSFSYGQKWTSDVFKKFLKVRREI